MRFVTNKGIPLEQAFNDIVQSAVNALKHEAGAVIQKSLLDETKEHISQRYPASKHYDTNKVVDAEFDGSSGAIDINIAGITRALHDIDIKPKNASYLTIPMHISAYGKSARSFNDLFVVKTKNGNKFLAKHAGGNILMMYFLCQHVHQWQDRSLLPTGEQYFSRIYEGLSEMLDQKIKSKIQQV